MGTIDEVCKRIVADTDGALACAVVDLRSGILLGIFNAAGYPSQLNDVVAAATLDLFRGPSIRRVAQMVQRQRGESAGEAGWLEEVQLTSRNNHHFAKCSSSGAAVVVLVTRRSTSAGLGWARMRTALAALEPMI